MSNSSKIEKYRHMIIMKTKLCNSLNVFATNTNRKNPKINKRPPPGTIISLSYLKGVPVSHYYTEGYPGVPVFNISSGSAFTPLI